MGETALFLSVLEEPVKKIESATYGKTQSDGGRHIWEKRLFLTLRDQSSDWSCGSSRQSQRGGGGGARRGGGEDPTANVRAVVLVVLLVLVVQGAAAAPVDSMATDSICTCIERRRLKREGNIPTSDGKGAWGRGGG